MHSAIYITDQTGRAGVLIAPAGESQDLGMVSGSAYQHDLGPLPNLGYLLPADCCLGPLTP